MSAEGPHGGHANTPRSLTLPAPAKLNLFLHVTGRRADGYHTLESLFVLIAHGDSITLSARDDGAIVRTRGPGAIAPDDDLAVRAARLLQRHCRVHHGVSIDVDKRLPMGSGLGGGSSDAGTVLLGLNRLWNLGLSRGELMEVGLGTRCRCAILRFRRIGLCSRNRRHIAGDDVADYVVRRDYAVRRSTDRGDLHGAMN